MDDQMNNMKQTFSLSDIEFLSSLPGPNSYFEGPIHEFPHYTTTTTFPHHQLPAANQLDTNNFPAAAAAGLMLDHELLLASFNQPNHRKRKATDINDVIMTSTPVNTSAISSPQVSHNNNNNNNVTRKTKRGVGRGKKEKEEETAAAERDVVHVRARRGQATDSHSLAERDRRRKINDRLRCLQDIVPGCYKSMGMAVMLDEIINYVQSLQSQVEFLSTRLTVASTFYDFNPDTNYAMEETMQGFRAKAIEDVSAIQEFQSAQFAAALNFECGPQLPHNL